MSGHLTDADREALAPFTRDGLHDETCSPGCFADHGTADALVAIVERLIAQHRQQAAAEALREKIEDWATSDLDTGDVIGTVSEAAMFKVGYVAAQSEVLGLLLRDRAEIGAEAERDHSPAVIEAKASVWALMRRAEAAEAERDEARRRLELMTADRNRVEYDAQEVGRLGHIAQTERDKLYDEVTRLRVSLAGARAERNSLQAERDDLAAKVGRALAVLDQWDNGTEREVRAALEGGAS